ncbi:MAG: hypothetical protein EOP04_10770 [Proteobacteria bacterium]|nr:MAG: hypothetical protein EOP04_10770 [Pseudomonadota bacterium]
MKQLRSTIARTIPKFPNDRQTLAILEAKSLGSIFIDYINWAFRLVPHKPRTVIIEPTLAAAPRWKALSADINAFLEKVRAGENVNPNLSLRVFKNGFTPNSSIPAPSTDTWEDKDFFLNTMGYHHFHLSQVIEKAGHAKRTDEVLFAQVTREHFHAISLFDHSVFEKSDAATQSMTAERNRLWGIYEHRNSIGRKPGTIYIENPITTSGHALFHSHLAMEYARIVYQVDPKLDSLAGRAEIFQKLPHETIKAMKLSWHMQYLDFGLLDKTTSTFFVLRYGPT